MLGGPLYDDANAKRAEQQRIRIPSGPQMILSSARSNKIKSAMVSKPRGLLHFLLSEYNHPFKGWDFSYITQTGRMSQGLLTWSYGSIVLPRIRRAKSLLDVGTGGGELLFSFRPLPKVACATESYKPNVSLAIRLLEPIGVKVFQVKDESRLPFKNDFFDLVMDRHDSYSPKEIYRILGVNGQFITQQVGNQNDNDLRRVTHATKFKPPPWDLRIAGQQLANVGFHIDMQREEFPVMRFYDVGALVYYLKAVPWIIPDFSVKKYFDSLRKAHERIQNDGYLEVKNHRFIIVATK